MENKSTIDNYTAILVYDNSWQVTRVIKMEIKYFHVVIIKLLDLGVHTPFWKIFVLPFVHPFTD